MLEPMDLTEAQIPPAYIAFSLANISFIIQFVFYQDSKDEPDCKSDPGGLWQLHHQVDVDEDAEDREDGHEGDLEA